MQGTYSHHTSTGIKERESNVEEMIFCIDCEYARNAGGEGIYRCQHKTALLFRSLVTSNMPTCEDMRSNNGRGCAPTATWFKAKKAPAKVTKK